MVKEQVDPEVLAADLNWILASNESKADAEFDQEIADLVDRPRISGKAPWRS